MIFSGRAAPGLGQAHAGRPAPIQAACAAGQIVVAGAGPVSNLLLALLFTAGLFVAVRVAARAAARQQPLAQLLSIGVQLNVLLAIFNLVPLPPLDGSHVVEWALPNGMGAPLHGDDRPVRRLHPARPRHERGALPGSLAGARRSCIGFLYSLVR